MNWNVYAEWARDCGELFGLRSGIGKNEYLLSGSLQKLQQIIDRFDFSFSKNLHVSGNLPTIGYNYTGPFGTPIQPFHHPVRVSHSCRHGDSLWISLRKDSQSFQNRHKLCSTRRFYESVNLVDDDEFYTF